MASAYSVIIPVLRDKAALSSVLSQLRAFTPAPEIIVVDSSSKPVTDVKGVKLLHRPQPVGFGRMVKDAVQIATNESIVVLDIAAAPAVGHALKFVEALEKGNDLVVSTRHGAEKRVIFTSLLRFISGSHLPDTDSGLFAFKKSHITPLLHDLCEGRNFVVSALLISSLKKKFVSGLSRDDGTRMSKSKMRVSRESLSTVGCVLSVIASYSPFRLFVPMIAILGFLAMLSIIEFFVLAELAFLLFFAVYITGAFAVLSIGLLSNLRSTPRNS